MTYIEHGQRPTLWRTLTWPVGPVFIVGRFALSEPSPRAAELLDRSSLPVELKSIIAEVVRRTRLWHREQADVARELIAHFEDALAAGVSRDEAMQAFGDPAGASRLIRSAKRRARGLLWRTWLRAWQTVSAIVILSLVVYLLLLVRLHASSPTIARDYIAELSGPALTIPDDQRAWPFYKEAYLALGALPDGLTTQRSPGRYARPGDANWPEVQQYVREHQHVLALARRAAGRPSLGYALTNAPDVEIYMAGLIRAGHDEEYARRQAEHLTDHDRPLFFQLTDVHAPIMLARMLAADTRDAAVAGESDRAAANLLALARMGEQLREVPMVIGDQVGFGMIITASRLVLEIAHQQPSLFSDEDLRHIAHSIGMFGDGGRLHPDLSGEHAMAMDLIQRIYSDDGRGDGRLTTEGIDLLKDLTDWSHASTDPLVRRIHQPALHPLLAARAAGRAETTAELDRLYTVIESDLTKAPWEWIEPPGLGFMLDPGHEQWRLRHPALAIAVPHIAAFAERAEQARLFRDTAAIVIALELERRRSGRYPEELGALTPGLLPRIPLDPFDGRPIRYRLDEEGQPVLYVVGANRKDDGGIAPPDDVIMRERRNAMGNAMTNMMMHSLRGQRSRMPVDGDWILFPPE